jgi:hypothetical protein
VRRAGHAGDTPFALGEAVFEAVASGHSGVVLTENDYEETWRDLIRHPDGKIALAIPELLPELRVLADQPRQAHSDEYPFVLAAGERCAYNANQVSTSGLAQAGPERRVAHTSCRFNGSDARPRSGILKDSEKDPRYEESLSRPKPTVSIAIAGRQSTAAAARASKPGNLR